MFPTFRRLLQSTIKMTKDRLKDLNFSSSFLEELPYDKVCLSYTNPNARDLKVNKKEHLDQLNKVKKEFKTGSYSLVAPESMPFPKLLHYSESCLEELDLDKDTPLKDPDFLKYVTGNETLPNTYSWSHCYAGHQFGSFAGRLGDGRAMSLVEVINSKGKRWELQLKGSGETPYSRMGDGFAVLRSSVREYLGSEANHALGIPTTRALSLVVTSQLVHRESLEPGAIVCRLSPSWIRFGSFQIFQMTKETEPLRILANYVIKYHFPELIENLEDKDSDCFPVEIYKEFYKEVARRTAKLVASWQAVGFCHGVLNTDNMSILGLTLDYGPFGYFSNLAPSWSPNLSDYTYRYSYKNQPAVGAWNLKMLGQALNPLFEEDNEIIPLPIYDEGEAQCSKFITDVTLLYDDMFLQEFYQLMNKKLGLPTYKVEDEDELVNLLLKLLADNSVDYHNFFRRLSHMTNIFPITKDSVYKDIIKYLLKDGIGNNDMDKIEDENKWLQWLTMYISRLTQEYDEKEITQISKSMLKVNPRFLLRNWVAQEVNDELYKENFKSEKLRIIYDLTCKYPYAEDDEIDYVAHPYLTKEILEHYSGPGTESSKELKCSCSS